MIGWEQLAGSHNSHTHTLKRINFIGNSLVCKEQLAGPTSWCVSCSFSSSSLAVV